MKKDINLYFDKECPFCNYYAKYNLLRTNHNLNLYNAREYPQKIKLLREKGFDINAGIIIEVDEEIFQGSNAVKQLNKLSTKEIKILNTKLFSIFLYPIIKSIRKVVLFILKKDFKIK
ncbi:putative thiol-disulfide oxidoreductase DCC [Arcobacter nitrofigilis DSM 7299]|uniref:Putative thiol-disulfide oxidoreductase DCC n=1 Tax=Arcobacter nitrofigilis (strain ATCC 33309 / DSM 7299 / CCUG 15893 / LMG 7604 / NCTC 12251 / CI) TaxID=572480 RepID=D5V5H7_ARCNC|nr:thiol-disulfide oxidoreductase DCC [Arcobacter nitrofigilis]ADG93112.1 putative thiol-disulfide oxidoreductase DCC [Arcobacter nitrofigilis DSM 7299]